MAFINYFDIFVGLIFVLCILCGLITKLKRSTLSFISFLIPALALIILINPITKGALNATLNFEPLYKLFKTIDASNLPKQGTLPDLLTVYISNTLATQEIVMDADMIALVHGAGYAFAKIFIYIGGIIIAIFAQIINSIILNIIFKKQFDFHKPLIGMGVRFAKFILIFFVIFFPIYGGISSAKIICDDIVDTVNIAEAKLDTKGLVAFSEDVSQSFVQKTFLNGFNKEDDPLTWDAKWFNKHVLTFKVETEEGEKKVALYDEFQSVKESLPTILKLSETAKSDTELDLSKFETEDIDKIVDLATNSTIVRLIFPTLSKILLNGVSDQMGINFSTDSVVSWDDEIPAIGRILKDIVDLAKSIGLNPDNMLDNLEKDETNKTKLVALIKDMTSSAIFKQAIVPLINKALESYDSNLKVSITPEDEEKIQSWEHEISIILDIFKDAIDLYSDDSGMDYTNLDAEKVRSLMLNASDSVIACKLIGTALNELFAEKVNTDFTVKENMKTSAETVYNLIKISNTVSTGTLDVTSTDDIKEAVSSLAELVKAEQENAKPGESGVIMEVVNGLASEVLGYKSDVQIEPEQVIEAAGILTQAMDEYTEFVDQGLSPENFDFNDLSPELKQKIENSSFADLVFSYLF